MAFAFKPPDTTIWDFVWCPASAGLCVVSGFSRTVRGVRLQPDFAKRLKAHRTQEVKTPLALEPGADRAPDGAHNFGGP